MTTPAPVTGALDALEPEPVDPIGPLSAPSRLRADRLPAGAALGATGPMPRLSWEIAAAPAGWSQARAEVEVRRIGANATAIVEEAVLEGPSPLFRAWPFAPLASRERAEVRVRVFGEEGASSAWSEPLVIETGPLDRDDWSARPILARGNARTDPAPVLVRRFAAPEDAVSARLHITAGGVYEVFLDGERIGADQLAPGWTEYRNRHLVQTHDVPRAVEAGEHELAIVLGNGWYRGHLTWAKREAVYGAELWALAQLEIAREGGPDLVIGTDATWGARPSNVVANDLYDGQTTDFTRPDLGDPGEETGVEELPLPDAALAPTTLPMPRVIGELAPTAILTTPSGKRIVDFGQNLAGHVRLRAHGDRGAVVVLRHAEVLENGELGTRPLRGAEATDRAILSGGDDEFAPSLTQHGFRYVEVEGFPGDDALLGASIVARVVSADLARTGWFDCSDALVAKLAENTRWSEIDNFLSVPTDCPQRDERLGWTGDIGVFAPTALDFADAGAFLASWLEDLAWAQTPDGALPVVSPDVLDGTKLTSAWGDAIVFVPWAIYEATGDASVLEASLPAMSRFVDGVAEVAGPARLWRGGFQFGDWLDPDAPPQDPGAAKADPDVVSTAYFARSAELTARSWRIVGDEARAERYGRLADEVRSAYLDAYVTADGLVLSDCATVYAQALAWGLLDTERRRLGAGTRLADLVRLRSFRISTGFVGTPLVPAALVIGGQAATASRLVLEKECPSWLYPVTMGATSIWERWDSMLPDGSINPGEMTSFNHYALGAVAHWLISDLAGLGLAAPGGAELRIAPQVGNGFTSARATRRLPLGVARCAWSLEGRRLRVEAEVPVGARATLELPGAEAETIGHGLHVRELDLPAAPETEILTVRDLIDDEDAWARVVAAVAGTHGAYMRDPASTLTGFLKKELDTTARVVPGAATMYGFIPGMEAAAAALSTVIDEVAPRAPELPSAQRG